MTNSKKRFICLEAAMAAMVIVLVFIMVKEHIGKPSRKISVILQDSNSSQWSAFRYGLKMAAEDQGVEVFIASIGDGLTVHEQINAVKYEIDNGADAVIVHPVPGTNIEAKLKKIEKKVPVILVECTASKNKYESMFPTVEPDNYAMGKALAEELLTDYNKNLKGKTLGIVTDGTDSECVINRRKGFQDVMENTSVKIRWSISSSFGKFEENSLENQPKVDLIIALDNTSLIAAGEYSALNDLHGALVYGIGNSTEAVYYLDTSNVECLVIPDEFNVGYQSLTEVAKSLEHYFYKLEDRTLSYTVLRKEELFLEKNQEIIFTMSQY